MPAPALSITAAGQQGRAANRVASAAGCAGRAALAAGRPSIPGFSVGDAAGQVGKEAQTTHLDLKTCATVPDPAASWQLACVVALAAVVA